MKRSILTGSLVSFGLALGLDIYGVIAAGGAGTVMQLGTVIGVFGIASFLVGLAYPSTVTETYVIDQNGQMNTRTVVAS